MKPSEHQEIVPNTTCIFILAHPETEAEPHSAMAGGVSANIVIIREIPFQLAATLIRSTAGIGVSHTAQPVTARRF